MIEVNIEDYETLYEKDWECEALALKVEINELRKLIRLLDDCAGSAEGVGLLNFLSYSHCGDSEEYIKIEEILNNEM